jgi:hypothetical protein
MLISTIKAKLNNSSAGSNRTIVSTICGACSFKIVRLSCGKPIFSCMRTAESSCWARFERTSWYIAVHDPKK